MAHLPRLLTMAGGGKASSAASPRWHSHITSAMHAAKEGGCATCSRRQGWGVGVGTTDLSSSQQ